jgi:hypothetical protein
MIRLYDHANMIFHAFFRRYQIDLEKLETELQMLSNIFFKVVFKSYQYDLTNLKNVLSYLQANISLTSTLVIKYHQRYSRDPYTDDRLAK